MTGLGSSCGACKFLRRKCSNECVFAPYFCYDEAASHFAAVHKVFGASNVSKLLLHLPSHQRSHAASTISFEALARMRDPIYGCVAHIFALQQQVAYLQEEIEILGSQIATNFTFGVESCGSTCEATNNSNYSNIYVGTNNDQYIPQQNVTNPQFHRSNTLQEILGSQPQNYSSQAGFLDVHVGPVQLPTMCGFEEEDNNNNINVMSNSSNSLSSDPLEFEEGLFEGIDQWLDDI